MPLMQHVEHRTGTQTGHTEQEPSSLQPALSAAYKTGLNMLLPHRRHAYCERVFTLRAWRRCRSGAE